MNNQNNKRITNRNIVKVSNLKDALSYNNREYIESQSKAAPNIFTLLIDISIILIPVSIVAWLAFYSTPAISIERPRIVTSSNLTASSRSKLSEGQSRFMNGLNTTKKRMNQDISAVFPKVPAVIAIKQANKRAPSPRRF